MASFGETLKRERELREISLRQISEATKINLRYLEALEENRFDALPGGLFNKGFIRAYATYIGIDCEATVNSYLQEVSARQSGSEAAPSRATPNLHRPQEAPARRASPGAPADRPRSSAHPPVPRRAQETRLPSPAASGAPARSTPAQSETRATLAALERVLDHPVRPAVTGIEVADPHAPGSSRVLVWVLSLVAAAGVLFLVVSLVRGTKPGAQPPADRPVAMDEAMPGTPAGGTAQPTPEAEGAPQPPGGSAVIPEISSQSPLILGTTGAPPVKSAASPPVAKPARTEPARRAPLPPAGPTPGDDRTGDRAGADDGGTERGPMKIRLEARGRTYVVLTCDGREVLNRVMESGESERARCDAVVRVSASDAGAVILSVNGDTCLPLGDPGTRAYGYTIRVDDHARICPAAAGGADGRP